MFYSALKPVSMTTNELFNLLADIQNGIAKHDSFGGYLHYEASDERDVWDVVANYRVGNSDGQGGTVMIGKVPGESE